MQKVKEQTKITEEFIKDIQKVTTKCDFTAKQAEQLMTLSVKVNVPPERVAATIILYNYDDPNQYDSLQKHAKDMPRYKRILDIINEVSKDVFDSSSGKWKRGIKAEYAGTFDQLKKKEGWFKNNYGNQ